MAQVVFGTGAVGLALVDHLAAAGEEVTAVNRRGNADVPDGVDVVGGDASDPEFTSEVVQGASVIYQCLNPPYTRWPELFPPLQSAVVKAAATAGAKVVSFENLYLYGPTGGAPLTEDLPSASTDAKGQVRAQMAAELLAAHDAGTVRVAIGRASDYFGPRGLVSHMGERVFYPALAGKNARVMGDPGSAPHVQLHPGHCRRPRHIGCQRRCRRESMAPSQRRHAFDAFLRREGLSGRQGRPARCRQCRGSW